MEHVAIHCHPTLIHPILIPQHAIPNPQTPMPTWYHSRICTFPQNMEHSSTFIIHIDPYSSNIHTSNPQSSTPNPQSQPGITLVFTLSPPTEHGALHLVRSVQPQTLSHDAVAVETKQLVCVQLGIT